MTKEIAAHLRAIADLLESENGEKAEQPESTETGRQEDNKSEQQESTETEPQENNKSEQLESTETEPRESIKTEPQESTKIIKITKEDIRKVLAQKVDEEKTEQVRELLGRYGADCLSHVDPKDYAALLREAEVL